MAEKSGKGLFMTAIPAPISLLYPLFEMNHAALQPARMMANFGLSFWQNTANPLHGTKLGRQATAALTMFERATRRYAKPEFGLVETMVDGKAQPIEERVVWQTPFCNLLHFAKPSLKKKQAKLLLVAPMSGHFATLLRDTVKTMLPEFDCYVTDWQDARDIPVSAGRFDLDDYTDTVIDILHRSRTTQDAPIAKAWRTRRQGPTRCASASFSRAAVISPMCDSTRLPFASKNSVVGKPRDPYVCIACSVRSSST